MGDAAGWALIALKANEVILLISSEAIPCGGRRAGGVSMNDYWLLMGLLGVFMAGFMWFLLAWHDEKVRREDLQIEVRHLRRELDKARRAV